MLQQRVNWLLFRRRKLARAIPGFWAHWRTFADQASYFAEYNRLYPGTTIAGSSLGRFSYVTGATVRDTNIGSFCSIGPEALLGGLGHHPAHWLSTHPAFYSIRGQAGKFFADRTYFDEQRRIVVGHDVWVGARAIILDGVQIGNGAIVAAGAVVTRDVPSYAIVGGIPAKLIRYRFAPDVIEALEAWEWWNLPERVLLCLQPTFIGQDSWTLEDLREIQARGEALL